MAKVKPAYAQINRKIWNTCQFRALSQNARQLYFYLMTCPHGNTIGMYVLRPGYALDDLQWGTDRQRFMQPLTELLNNGLFKYDPDAEIILDVEQLEKHPPSNPNSVTAAIRNINTLPKTPLFQDLLEVTERIDKPFIEPLAERLRKRLGEQRTGTGTGTGTVLKDIVDKKTKRARLVFIKPSFDDVKAYCMERKNNVNPQVWLAHYESNGWKVGKNPMVDWKAAVRTWEQSGGNGNGKHTDDTFKRSPKSTYRNSGQRQPAELSEDILRDIAEANSLAAAKAHHKGAKDTP